MSSLFRSSFAATAVTFKRSGAGAAVRDAFKKMGERVSVEDFGAKGDGATDDTASFTAAINYVIALGGGQVELCNPSYFLSGVAGADGVKNGVLVPFMGGLDDLATSVSVEVVGRSRDTKLLAGSNNMILFRLSASYCSVRNLSLMANGRTGVTALALVPQNLTAPAEQSQQSFNQIENIYTSRCAEGLVLQCGGAGGAYYNEFAGIHIHGGSLDGTRGVYFKTGIATGTTPQPSNVNRNQFFSVRVGYCNTGFDIESGDTNTFFGCSTEGVAVGTLPTATPTAIKVANVDGKGRGNDGNKFFGFVSEACTADLWCMNDRTHFFGCDLAASKSTLSATFPTAGTMIGSYDRSSMPTIYGGYVHNGGTLPTGLDATKYEVGAAAGGFPHVDQSGGHKAYALTVAKVANATSISGVASAVTKSGKWVDWAARFAVHPAANNSILRITAPFTADNALYATYGTIPPLEIPVWLTLGGVRQLGIARFNYDAPIGTLLEIILPSGQVWNVTAGDNNVVQFNLRYREA